MSYKPPYEITNTILKLIQQVFRELGLLSGAKLTYQSPHLRKSNRIKTIQSSLAIEGNTLSIEQITAVLEGKRVIAPKRDLIEAENALKVYHDISKYDALSIQDFLNCHMKLLSSLVKDNGVWRNKSVGILQGDKVAHVAPQAKMIPTLMHELFNYLNSTQETSWIIKACVFHYELEFIHPFSDGNGRMGRLWQQIILMKEDKIFEYLPIETLIKNNQLEYYNVLSRCDKLGNSTEFIEFMLQQILLSLTDFSINTISNINSCSSRIQFAIEHFQQQPFSRKDYILLHKNISSATASRDLKQGLKDKILQKLGQHNQTLYKASK